MRLPVHRTPANVRAKRSGAFMEFARQCLRRRLKPQFREIARRIFSRIESILILDHNEWFVLHALPFRVFPRSKANIESVVRQRACLSARIRV